MNCISKACEILDYTIFIDTWNKHSGNITSSNLCKHCSIRSHAILARNESELDTVELGICLHNLHNMR